MANKRDFKKAVDAVGSVLTEEMLYAYVNVEKADKQAISAAVGQVLDAVENARKRANIFFDKGVRAFEDRKAYGAEKKAFFRALFNKINTEFDGSVNDALKKFNGALPEDIKEGLKQSVQ